VVKELVITLHDKRQLSIHESTEIGRLIYNDDKQIVYYCYPHFRHNLTIVTAISNFSSTYLNYGKQLLSLKIPKIIFIEQNRLNQLTSLLSPYNLLIPCDVTTSKLNLIQRVLQINLYQSNQFMWIDFDCYRYIEPIVHLMFFNKNNLWIVYIKLNTNKTK